MFGSVGNELNRRIGKCITVVSDVFGCIEVFGVSWKCIKVVWDIVECFEVF